MPFDEEDELEPTPPKKSSGVKLKNNNSIFDKIPQKPSQEQLIKEAEKVNIKLSSYNEKGLQLSSNFAKAIRDKTLTENKTSFANSAENDLLADLVNLAIEMNNDNHEVKDGMGSVAIGTLLLRVALIQRDKINSLEYALKLLDKKVQELQQKPLDNSK